MHALAVEIRDIRRDCLGDLPVDANGTLHVYRSVKVWIDLKVNRCVVFVRCARTVERLDRYLLVRLFSRGRHIVGNRLDDEWSAAAAAKGIGYAKALKEPSVTGAQHRLGRLLAAAIKRVGEGNARRPVVLIVDPVLRLVAETVAEGEAGTQ